MKKEYIQVEDTKLGVIIEGEDQEKPVLLFLGGGPGIPEYFLEEWYPTKLKEHFTVCYLEYRGTSLSYSTKINKSTMNTKQFVKDVVDVATSLKQRYDKSKIYLMAHSFGTYIGLNVAAQHPELFYAYIPISQMCNQHQSEYDAYDYMLNIYRQQKNKKKVKTFEKCNIKESEKTYERYCTSMLRDQSMHGLGIGTTRDMKSIISGIILPSLVSKSYSLKERINIWRGKIFSQNATVAKEAWNFNAFDEIKKLHVPIYFLAGRYDYTCCYHLQKAYFDQISAPQKAFYTFDNSAHSPLFEEPEKAMQILLKNVLE